MIGGYYWCTGIEIKSHDFGLQWSASAAFYDHGFCESESTQGVFHLRYPVSRPDLPRYCQILKADMERLGIKFCTGVESVPATVYVFGSEDPLKAGLPNDWRDLAAKVAIECGLEFPRHWYAREVAAEGERP